MSLSDFLKQIDTICSESCYSVLDRDTAEDIIEQIRIICDKLDIKMIYESLKSIDESRRFRIVFNSSKSRADYSQEVVRKCNGLIIMIYQEEERIKSRLLCSPYEDFDTRYSIDRICENFDRYDIYDLEDGTTINLYYLDGWQFSSKNTYSISDMTWRGKAYKEVIDECLSVYKFNFDLLDKTKTYTIGFKHPAYHPLAEAPAAWSITDTPGLEPQKRLDISEKEFRSRIKAMNNSVENYLSNKKRDLGLVLRSRNTAEVPNIIIMSDLMQLIRNMIYNLPRVDKNKYAKYKKYFQDMRFVLIINYLNVKNRNIFLNIFPQFSGEFKVLDGVRNKVAEIICRNAHPHLEREKRLAQQLARFCKPNNLQLTKDIIYHPKHALQYYEALYE